MSSTAVSSNSLPTATPTSSSASATTSPTPFFTSATQSTPVASSTGTSTSVPSSSSLYLYTFLATLVLLLGISAAIVVRSFVLRQRQQGVIEDAIRNGTWAPSTFGGIGRGRRDVGEKPQMWEAWVGKDRERPTKGGLEDRDIAQSDCDADLQKGCGSSSGSNGCGWNTMLPISATYLNPPTTRSALPSTPSGSRNHRVILPWRHRIYSPSQTPTPALVSSSALNLPAGTATSSPPPPPPPLPIPTPGTLPLFSQASLSSPATPLSPADPPNPILRLTVLVAMPSPPSARHTRDADGDEEEEGPPVVEFGVVDVDVRNNGNSLGGGLDTNATAASSDRGDDAGDLSS